jgi:hypothetical protein
MVYAVRGILQLARDVKYMYSSSAASASYPWQATWGKCGEPWMAQFCQFSCQHCTCGSSSGQAGAAPAPEILPTISSQAAPAVEASAPGPEQLEQLLEPLLGGPLGIGKWACGPA